MQNKKQGISLVILVVTIIIMIILAGAVVITLNNTNIIDRAEEVVNDTNTVQIQEMANLGWLDAYMKGKRTQPELEQAVKEYLKENGVSDKVLEDYIIDVTTEKVTISAIPTEWSKNVVDVVDGVPIPKGFVASPYDGENTKNNGLVIYELKASETGIPSSETHHTSLTTRNQYVWVPVSKNTFATKFVRKNFGMGYTLSTVLGTEYWEIEVDNNMPIVKEKLSDYIADGDLDYISTNTLAEVQAMYASVKEYGGFYIARYEAGIDSQRTSNTALITGNNVHSKMGKIPYSNISWSTGDSMNVDTGGAVEVARGLYTSANSNYGVVSTLTYGVQWDTALQWFIDTGAMTLNEATTYEGSIKYGNYKDHVIGQGELNADAQYAFFDPDAFLESFKSVAYTDGVSTSVKESGTKWLLSTGALKDANVNNVYDMAGNIIEWTMEGYSTGFPVARGGDFYYNYPVAYRHDWDLYYYMFFLGFRPSLYIKK